ncbi:MAG: DUF169 domain-containing protein [Acidobacteriaceae bacterium]|nr:DUF169 domain-containing protein [Acidobacteriaceae bacterium]
MSSYADVSESLTRDLQLAQPPIAVCFSDRMPEGVERWSGHVPAGCRFWQEAATRVFATAPGDHVLCSIGQYTHNLDMSEASVQDLKDTLKVLGDLTYVREQDLPQIPVLSFKPKFVVYGPLDRVPLDPDVVLLFVAPNQTLILSEASQQLERGLPPAMGRPACAVIPQARNTGQSALSLGCCGARAYLDVLADSVALYAIPGSRLAEFAERVAALAKANQVLTRFHQVRRGQVTAGLVPAVQESLAAM